MATDWFELDVATADRIAALAASNFYTDRVVRLAGGTNSAVFDLRSGDGRSLVVKIYSDELHWKMQKEVLVYEQLRGRALAAPVPMLLASDDSKALLGQNILVITKLDGEHVDSILRQLDERELISINRQIGAALASLHEITFEEFGYLGTHGVVDGHLTNLEYMRFQFDEKLREFDHYGGDRDLGREIERYVVDREDLLTTPLSPVFCHNDCYYGNVLVVPHARGMQVSGLVDFENVLAGDPVLDLAKTHCYARDRRSEATLAALAAGHGRLPPNWREVLDVYVLYHWLELWDWFALLGNQDPLVGLNRDMLDLVGGDIAPTL